MPRQRGSAGEQRMRWKGERMKAESKRPGVMVYFSDIKPALNRMDDAQCGRLLRAIVYYAETGTQPEIDGIEALVFDMLISKIDRDGERYEESREQRQFAVYCREAKRRGEQPLSISEWRLLRLSSGNGPITSDNGSYPSASASTSTSASASTTASASISAAAFARAAAGGYKGEDGGAAPPPDMEERKKRVRDQLTKLMEDSGYGAQ